MHEVGIANSIPDAVKAELDLHPGKVPRKIAVRIGELSAIDLGLSIVEGQAMIADSLN